MSINPVDHSATFDTAAPQRALPPAAGGAEFGEAFAKALQQEDGKLDPAAAAEMLRLKMLSSAVSIGGDGERPGSSGVSGMQRALDRFLANLAQEQGKTADGDGTAPGAEAGVAAIDADAPSAAQPAQGAGGALSDIIDKAAKSYGVDRGLIRAVIKAESNFNPCAVSPAGAQGLMQLMPGTARSLGVRDSFDPEQNVMAGTRFLKDLLNRYGGDVDSALAAYNWGPGNFEKNGRLPRETRDYLVKVKGYYNQFTA